MVVSMISIHRLRVPAVGIIRMRFRQRCKAQVHILKLDGGHDII